MIFPILSGFIGWKRAPIVWTLVLLNLLVLTLTNLWGADAQQGLDEMMRKSYFINTQGRLYAHYLEGQVKANYPEFLLELGTQVEHGTTGHSEILGQMAFRDLNFIKAAPDMKYDGDQVAFEFWKKHIHDVLDLQDRHPSFVLGLNSRDVSLTRWVTYIFVHSGWVHFLGNMIFLIVFGAALELQIGGLATLIVFLLSGVVAAGIFALVTGVTSSPLVGASGAISGIMALYCFLNWSKPTRYFYWFFLPIRGYMGFVYFPAWVALVLWVAGDLAGYLGSLPELGGVAHTAHLGGEAAGLLTGIILFTVRKLRSQPESRAESNSISAPIPLGVLFPFLPPGQ